MKVQKDKFDGLLSKVLKAKPIPREKIKSRGKRGPKLSQRRERPAQ